MSRFTVLVTPDGKALLTSTEQLTESERAALVVDLERWRSGAWPSPVATIESCDVVQVESIDVDPSLALVPA